MFLSLSPENCLKIQEFCRKSQFRYLENGVLKLCRTTTIKLDSYQRALVLFYYDIEEKNKDKDEDEERETNFNKKASTHACTQTSSPIGRLEQQRSCSENRPERFLPQDWEDSSSDSENCCDMRIDGDFL